MGGQVHRVRVLLTSYQHLKKVVYELEREQVAALEPHDGSLESESQTLLDDGDSQTDHVFVPYLDKELRKIIDFYCTKERELTDETHVVQEHMRLAEEEFHTQYSEGSDADVSNEDEDEERGLRRHSRQPSAEAPTSHQWIRTFGKKGSFRRLRPQASSTTLDVYDPDVSRDSEMRHRSVWTTPDEYAVDIRLTIKRQLNELYMHLSELAQYVDINETGMKKILKKYDKITHSHLLGRYLEQVVRVKYPFQTQAKQLRDRCIADVVTMYACVATRGDEQQAERQLKAQLREEVVWQRNTVWREMINIERRAQSATLEASLHPDSEQPGQPVHTPWGDLGMPVIAAVQLIASFGLFVALLKIPAFRIFDDVEEQNCLAIVVLCTCLWVTEVIPLFVTSLLVPFLIVTLRVARVENKHGVRRLTAPEASRWIFEQMFAPSIALLLGGFTLAAALSKYGIDKVLATRVLRLAGTRPSVVLLAHMVVACFASMWVSNVAAPVLLFSLVQPILRTLPPRSPYGKSIVMGIALASNIGGQTSPIASPQNLIALQYMDEPIGWIQWFAITIPVSGLSLLAVWVILLWSFGTGKGTVIRRIPESTDRLSRTQWFIASVCIGTIVLWCLEKQFEWIVGDMAVIALLPLVLFFGTGVLTKEDFNNFLWTIVFLAMGGIALGKGVSSSGLLGSLDMAVQKLVSGMSVWGILVLLLTICLVIATFISHTIAAVLLIPIAAQMGESLDPPKTRLLIMATTLTASAAMGLPISGFPNMTAVNLEDEVGHRYVTVKTFLRVGVPASIVATAIIGTFGYLIMTVLGL